MFQILALRTAGCGKPILFIALWRRTLYSRQMLILGFLAFSIIWTLLVSICFFLVGCISRWAPRYITCLLWWIFTSLGLIVGHVPVLSVNVMRELLLMFIHFCCPLVPSRSQDMVGSWWAQNRRVIANVRICIEELIVTTSFVIEPRLLGYNV